MKKFTLALLLLCPPLVAWAAPDRVESDLGHGLSYCRIHALPADLPPPPTHRGAVVLDLRYAKGGDDAAPALGAWLTARASTATPVIVVVNAETAPAALAYFAAHEPAAGVVTVGAASANFEPDIAIKFPPAAERAAYDALEKGAALASLLADTAMKPRHDEAALAQERAAGAEESDTTDADLADKPETKPAPPPVIDYALLRAVQLHRALLALRKI